MKFTLRSFNRILAVGILAASCFVCQAEPPLAAKVICEETVTVWLPPENGAGPLWCYGSPLLFRDGEDVYASVSETGADVPHYLIPVGHSIGGHGMAGKQSSQMPLIDSVNPARWVDFPALGCC
ncbi:hypothetical protein HS121_17800 [bacterium]|nr:hypothetical protein [bacterium]